MNDESRWPFPTASLFPPVSLESGVSRAQLGLSCWFRAWTQMANGLTSASVAQAELLRSVFAMQPVSLEGSFQPGAPYESARRMLRTTRDRYDALVEGYRRINDGLAASTFDAAENLVEGLSAESPAGTAGEAEPGPLLERKPLRRSA